MTRFDSAAKRIFDIIMAGMGLVLLSPVIMVAFIVASVETKSNGFFVQRRIGQYGQPFKLVKIKSMRAVNGVETSVTTSNDVRITKSGSFFRKTKIDELPQLWNVLCGNMSFVGPRPDVEGYADILQGADRVILSVKPGITGPASIAYKNEEEILSMQDNPEKYNLNVIFPDKVRINKKYIEDWSFFGDIKLILMTIF